jgi:serine/threonine-protein kinase
MAGAGLVGRTVGRYLVEREIGRGGMSVVYRARDLVRRRAVALKTARPGSGHDAGRATDLPGEGRWLVCCRAPHIVQVFDVGRHDGVEFIAMELMSSTLEALKADGPMSGTELVGVGAGMLLGLDAAHREGVLHGDIKPANVGLSSHGTVKLLDFGVARPLPGCPHDLKMTTAIPVGSVVGTMPYMAPEQVRGDEADERADIYGVGAVLYELATGRPPFCGRGIVHLIDAVLHARPTAPSILNPSIEPDTDHLLMTALAKAPSSRFQSAQEMLDALLQTGAALRAGDWTAPPAPEPIEPLLFPFAGAAL